MQIYRKNIIKKLNDEVTKIIYELQEQGERIDENKFQEVLQRVKSRQQINYKQEYLTQSDSIMSNNFLQLMPDYSEKLSKHIHEMNGINPVVYNSLVKTMRYSALFRYFKKHYSLKYRNFLQSISHITSSPSVQTPTVMISEKKTLPSTTEKSQQ